MHHDACGVGFVARISGRAGHDIVQLGLTAVRRLAHRGAPASLGAVDGCGLLTAIPWTLIADDLGRRFPTGRRHALASIFVNSEDCDAAKDLIEGELQRAGARCTWRSVPADSSAVLPLQRPTTPRVLQAVITFDRSGGSMASRLYAARLAIEKAGRGTRVRFSIASMSDRTVVYKALVPPESLHRFYPDLANPAFASPFALFHQRFSTNTSADWALAQPFRIVAHNGEINTITGNRSWLHARLRDASAFHDRPNGEALSAGGSDSQSLDEAIDLLRACGYSLAHATSRLIPPAWEHDRELPPDVRAFFEFQALMSEPWDGPSAVAFADGRFVGAVLDRNGFRPARITRTATGLIAVASEAGVLDVPEREIVDRDRLGPGDTVVVDLARGVVLRTNDVHRRLAFRRRYRPLVDRVITKPAVAASCAVSGGPEADWPAASVDRVQTAFGCTREEIDLIIKPMMASGHEAIGSMGDDAPPAALSRRSRLFTDYFRQRFAQVTNPPIDPYRESAVMSLTTLIGGQGDFVDERAARPLRVRLQSPILSELEMKQLRSAVPLAATVVSLHFRAADAALALKPALERIVNESCAATERGSSIVILSDRGIDRESAPVPALLAASAVHHALIDRGLRMRASVVVDTGDARDAHQIAALCAFGAAAVCPWLGYLTVRAIASAGPTGCEAPIASYRLALERGLLTIMSKMGVSTFAGYCGSQLFEILGLDSEVAARYFPGTAAFPGHMTLGSIGAAVIERHSRAFSSTAPVVDYPGLHGYRREGEYHAANPVVIRSLHRARNPTTDHRAAYETFTSHVYNRPPTAVRDLLELKPGASIPPDGVESVDAICTRFFASAMSVGALSPEAHRTIARAMNMLGARSNSGEGGEEPDRLRRPSGTDLRSWDGSRTKQIASARFGVTPAYLRSADELQIKIAQGSKPGEGGQLPAVKVVPHIAQLRHAQPGTTLISPPVHHDIYSIEDLAQLIFDLKTLHPAARISVKLVSSSGVGIVAVGVAKAGADAIQISGHDGGTGASPRGSIKHAGLPWEFGLADAHRALTRAGLRRRIVLQTDGGLKTGRDIAMAAALGADEFGFGTAALVAIGCVMARQCHANTCPVGIATQREDLRRGFQGTAAMLVAYLRLVANEVRQLLATAGLASVDALVGRVDLLQLRTGVDAPALHLDELLSPIEASPRQLAPAVKKRRQVRGAVEEVLTAATRRATIIGPIANTDRAVGADIAGEIAARFGDAGLPHRSRITIVRRGTAGQSFGAFALPGMRLILVGDANDGMGKGMHGGTIVVVSPRRERARPNQVRVGNAALYGATGGRVFIAGRAGERFAVRNSGATAVVEGVGDHACEYMTGGIVVILGSVGRNFASGMTGGIAYAIGDVVSLAQRMDARYVALSPLTDIDRTIVRDLLEAHEQATSSVLCGAIRQRDPDVMSFIRISPARSAVVVQSESQMLSA